jgi:hypothetical protein
MINERNKFIVRNTKIISGLDLSILGSAERLSSGENSLTTNKKETK